MSPGPLSIPLGPFRIFSKIRGDIREWMFISGVNDTCEKREKFWKKFYSYFVESLVYCNLHLKIEFLFNFQVLLTPPNNLSAVSLTPVYNFSTVSLTPARNFRLSGLFPTDKDYLPVSTTPALIFSPVSLTPLNSLSPVSTTLAINIHSRISPRIFEKIQNDPNGILGGLGYTDSWKNLKSKISCQTPFKHL